jgi:hypothetical protein
MTDLQFALTATEVAVVLGFSVGFLWGEAFSKFDNAVKYKSKFYPALSPLCQWLLGSLMDATHHFQYGLALVLLVMKVPWFLSHPTISLVLTWVGWGLIVSDWKDYKNILKRLNAALVVVDTPAT